MSRYILTIRKKTPTYEYIHPHWLESCMLKPTPCASALDFLHLQGPKRRTEKASEGGNWPPTVFYFDLQSYLYIIHINICIWIFISAYLPRPGFLALSWLWLGPGWLSRGPVIDSSSQCDTRLGKHRQTTSVGCK